MLNRRGDFCWHKESPSSLIPVPASQIMRVSPERISTHAEFPPTRAVLDPGVAIDPRTPQNVSFTLSISLKKITKTTELDNDSLNLYTNVSYGTSTRFLSHLYGSSSCHDWSHCPSSCVSTFFQTHLPSSRVPDGTLYALLCHSFYLAPR